MSRASRRRYFRRMKAWSAARSARASARRLARKQDRRAKRGEVPDEVDAAGFLGVADRGA